MEENIKQINTTFMDRKILVPYYSQYLSVEDKENCLKSCGMACVYMILSHHKIKVPSLNEMVLSGIKEGGIGLSGWNHNYFVKLFNDLGLKSERMEGMKDIDAKIIEKNISQGCPVIISAERIIFDRRIFHMVVITGTRTDEDGNLEGFFYHDPASLAVELAEHCYVPLKTFFLSWRRMAIFVQKK